MNIPEYAYAVANQCNISDAQLEEIWGQFCYTKLNQIESQSIKEFFLFIFINEGFATINKMFDFIFSNVRIPKTVNVERFKHEYIIYYINALNKNEVKLLLIWALTQICNSVTVVRGAVDLIYKRRSIKLERKGGIINFI